MARFIIVLIAIFSFSFSLDIISSTLANKTHKINWYFWSIEISKKITRYYLASGRDTESIKVWNFTNDRKWKPIHNAESFNGFNHAGINFDKISFSDSGDSISFGDKTISKNIAIDLYLEDLKNKTFPIGWYFWESESYPFLASGRTDNQGIKIWQFTSNGKWKPIHNASKNDGFDGVGNVFDLVEIDSNGNTIKIDKKTYSLPTPSKNKGLPSGNTVGPTFAVFSNDIKNDAVTTNGFPHIRWVNMPRYTESIAIEIVNTSSNNFQNVHFAMINIPADKNSSSITSSYPASATLLSNDFNQAGVYQAPTLTGSVVQITVYAIRIKQAVNLKNAKDNAIRHATILYKVN